MNTLPVLIIIGVLVVYILYLVFWARDRGQRGRAFQKLAQYFDGSYEIEPPKELREQLTAMGPARVIAARHLLQFTDDFGNLDIVDLRYLYNRNGRNRIATSTVGRFDFPGPAFRSVVDDGRRETSGNDPAEVEREIAPRLAAIEPPLDDVIVECDGEQVLVYRWRHRVQPDQFPGFKELVESVATALRQAR